MSRLAVEREAINLGQGFQKALNRLNSLMPLFALFVKTSQQYPPMMGLPVLRQAVAENAKRFLGLDVDWEEEVLVTSGAGSARRYFSGASGYGRRGYPVRAGLRCLRYAYPPRRWEGGAGTAETASWELRERSW